MSSTDWSEIIKCLKFCPCCPPFHQVDKGAQKIYAKLVMFYKCTSTLLFYNLRFETCGGYLAYNGEDVALMWPPCYRLLGSRMIDTDL